MNTTTNGGMEMGNWKIVTDQEAVAVTQEKKARSKSKVTVTLTAAQVEALMLLGNHAYDLEETEMDNQSPGVYAAEDRRNLKTAGRALYAIQEAAGMLDTMFSFTYAVEAAKRGETR